MCIKASKHYVAQDKKNYQTGAYLVLSAQQRSEMRQLVPPKQL